MSRRTSLLWCCLLLAACTVGPDYRRPAVEMPQGFPTVAHLPQSVSLERWWESMGDPLLIDLLQKALRENPSVQIALQHLNAARAVEKGADALSYPTVGGTLAASRRKTTPPTSLTPISDTYTAGFDATWEVDLWGGIQRQQEAAKAGTAASEADLADVRLSLLAEVGAQYVAFRVAQKMEAYTRQTIRSRQETQEIVHQKIRAGLTSGDDGTRADSQLAGAQAVLAQAQQAAASARLSLELLCGFQPGDLVEPLQRSDLALTSAPPAVVLPAQLLERRPDIRRAESLAIQAVALVGVAEANLFPRFDLLGALAASRVVPTTPWFAPFSVAATLNGVVFDAGALAAQVEEKDADAAQAVWRYIQTVRNAVSEVEQKLAAIDLGSQKVDALRRQAEFDRETLAISWERYRRGLTTFLDVADAERGTFATELALQQARGQVLTDSISLYKALGGGWIE
ncbi:MAG TPA: efflux transporter outer membrane subunit [Accumulibacter sp.]|uniref:efflux transporter outer membrane subunit n=1 Tax=Accumulibacter sp. TaxID=2053492 RepID=UPI0025EED17F|nr:efflux transporter outer membrane subunit [Accumulibacter sp.]MCM8662902.1 efflux transporter outer membrane subunit [Accumulibacter sp.]HNC52865.1 efflux transporter outer membrane subunit [Accumulibacter sp.]